MILMYLPTRSRASITNNIGYWITILPYKKIFGTRNPYDNRYGANIVRSGPKNSGDSEVIVITENIVVSGIVISKLYCTENHNSAT